MKKLHLRLWDSEAVAMLLKWQLSSWCDPVDNKKKARTASAVRVFTFLQCNFARQSEKS